VWKRSARGITFTFHLAGINNQNFLMRDDETGTYWQQISGRAISGPLAGTQLDPVHSDELSFGLWRAEAPQGSVLKPVGAYAGEYETKDWDANMARVKTVLDFRASGIPSRELMLGVEAFGASRAYPVKRILSERLIEDRLGSEPILVVVGADGLSIRVFRARLHAGEPAPEFYRRTNVTNGDAPLEPLFIDSATGSEWAFDGCAVEGKLAGTCLEPVNALKDYWFDWRNYHPATTVFRR
jgi:Protein of unknown function (DUF3179)